MTFPLSASDLNCSAMRAQGLRISDNFPIQTTKSNRTDIKLMSYRHDDLTGFALEDQSVMKMIFPRVLDVLIYEPHV